MMEPMGEQTTGTGQPAGDTREAILDAAERFLEHGRVRDLTVTRLMEPIPVSREAFYKHFPSRYAVIAALLGRFTHEVAAGFDVWLTSSDPVSDVRVMFDTASHAYVRRARTLRAVIDAAPMDRDLEAVWQEFIGGFVELAAARIRADQESGLTPASIDPALAAASIVHLTERLITQELAGPHPPTREEVVDLLTAAAVGVFYPTAIGDRFTVGAAMTSQ